MDTRQYAEDGLFRKRCDFDGKMYLESGLATGNHRNDGSLNVRFFVTSVLLSFAGGFADAGSYVLVSSFTGHITGNSILTAIAIVKQDWSQAFTSLLAVISFMGGTTIGLAWIKGRGLTKPLLAEIALIAFGAWMLTVRIDVGRDLFVLCLCLALGLQNGVLNKLGSVSVHSTFITGMSTSLVTSVIDGQQIAKRRVLPAVIACFLVGALCGAYLASSLATLGFAGILVPLVLALLLAAAERWTGFNPNAGANFDHHAS